jgi:hypothetical protein
MPRQPTEDDLVKRTLVLVLLPLLLLAGCAGRVRTVHESEGFSHEQLAAGRLAVGGVVLAARAAADPSAAVPDGLPAGDVLAQAEAWSTSLFGGLLAADPALPSWPYGAVAGACPDSVLAFVLMDFARGGVVKPERLVPVAAALPEIGYLALARVEEDDLTLHEGAEAVMRDQRTRDGRDPHDAQLDRSLKVRRAVTVTMDVYDLATGRSVWTATVTRHRDELYNFADQPDADRPPVVPEGRPVITAGGQPLPAAAFTRVLDDACGALARRLLDPEDQR